MQTLSKSRELTSKRLSGLELPSAFQAATVAAAINAQDRKTKSARASRARLVRKAYRLSEQA